MNAELRRNSEFGIPDFRIQNSDFRTVCDGSRVKTMQVFGNRLFARCLVDYTLCEKKKPLHSGTVIKIEKAARGA